VYLEVEWVGLTGVASRFVPESRAEPFVLPYDFRVITFRP
jgi:hypothetical protein